MTTSTKTRAVRIPEHLYAAAALRAVQDRRSVTQMISLLLESAIADDVGVPAAELWPGETSTPVEVVAPSQAEKDFATEDPVDPDYVEPPDLRPDDLEPIFAPVRSDEVTTDFKKPKK